MNLEEQFWSKVDMKGAVDCWLWQGPQDAKGYGLFWWKGRQWRAHRVAWELAYEPIHRHFMVLHRCDTPPCVNPVHLYLGTHRDNMRDLKYRGKSDWRTRVDR